MVILMANIINAVSRIYLIYALVFMITMTASIMITIAKPNIDRARVSASMVSGLSLSTAFSFVVLLSLALSVFVLVDHIHPFQQEILLHCRSVYKYGS